MTGVADPGDSVRGPGEIGSLAIIGVGIGCGQTTVLGRGSAGGGGVGSGKSGESFIGESFGVLGVSFGELSAGS